MYQKYGRNDDKVMLKKLNAVKLRAFTLIEMLVVLLIVSILLFALCSNGKPKDSVKKLEMQLSSKLWILKQNYMKRKIMNS